MNTIAQIIDSSNVTALSPEGQWGLLAIIAILAIAVPLWRIASRRRSGHRPGVVVAPVTHEDDKGLESQNQHPTEAAPPSWGTVAMGLATGIVAVLALVIGTSCDPAPREAETKPEPAIMLSIQQGRVEDVRNYLKFGGDPNVRGGAMGDTLLIAAVQAWDGRTRSEIVKLLLEAGADPNAANDSDRHFEYPPLMRAEPDVVPLLVQHGADVGYVGRRGTPLHHIAGESGASVAIRLLAEKGIDVNATAQDFVTLRPGTTALHIAANAGHLENVRALCELGARADVRDGQGKTALELAMERLHWPVVEYLKSYGQGGARPPAIPTTERAARPTTMPLDVAAREYRAEQLRRWNADRVNRETDATFIQSSNPRYRLYFDEESTSPAYEMRTGRAAFVRELRVTRVLDGSSALVTVDTETLYLTDADTSEFVEGDRFRPKLALVIGPAMRYAPGSPELRTAMLIDLDAELQRLDIAAMKRAQRRGTQF